MGSRNPRGSSLGPTSSTLSTSQMSASTRPTGMANECSSTFPTLSRITPATSGWQRAYYGMEDGGFCRHLAEHAPRTGSLRPRTKPLQEPRHVLPARYYRGTSQVSRDVDLLHSHLLGLSAGRGGTAPKY